MIMLTNDEGAVGITPGWHALRGGSSPVEAVEVAIKAVEADPRVRSVGRGGAPNLLGIVECDAAIMEGSTLRAGAVGALRGYLHAISAARSVMERLPHVMLVGEGAARFAHEVGLEPADMLTEEARTAYETWMSRHLPAESGGWSKGPLAEYVRPAPAARPRGTVICLARDRGGRMAAGASTSGWPYKYPGRLGDTPIIGAGIYVDDRWGACGCTYTGEMTIRCATARSVVLAMRRGASVSEACHEAARDLWDLHTGFIGPVVIHAMDHEGAPYPVAVRSAAPIDYWMWHGGLAEPRRQTCVVYDG